MKPGEKIGPLSQSELVEYLPIVIDTARSRAASKQRDDAPAMLKAIMATTHWKTSYVQHNLGTRRCRYLYTLGYPVDERWIMPAKSDLDRLHQMEDRRREGKRS